MRSVPRHGHQACIAQVSHHTFCTPWQDEYGKFLTNFIIVAINIGVFILLVVQISYGVSKEAAPTDAAQLLATKATEQTFRYMKQKLVEQLREYFERQGWDPKQIGLAMKLMQEAQGSLSDYMKTVEDFPAFLQRIDALQAATDLAETLDKLWPLLVDIVGKEKVLEIVRPFAKKASNKIRHRLVAASASPQAIVDAEIITVMSISVLAQGGAGMLFRSLQNAVTEAALDLASEHGAEISEGKLPEVEKALEALATKLVSTEVVRDVTTWTLTSAKSDVASCGWSLQETIDPNYLQLTLCMIDEMNRASQTEASSEPEVQEPETEHDSGVTVVEVTSNSGSGTGSMTAMRLEDHGSDNLFTLVRAMGSISSQSLLRPMELVKSIWEAAVLVLGHERVRSLYNSISEQTLRRGGNVSEVQVFLKQGLEGTFAPQRVTN